MALRLIMFVLLIQRCQQLREKRNENNIEAPPVKQSPTKPKPKARKPSKSTSVTCLMIAETFHTCVMTLGCAGGVRSSIYTTYG